MVTKETPSDRKTVAYLRVSTLDQDLEKNKADILHFANHHDLGKVNFVEEVASGRKPWRERQIAQVLEELQEGDAIIVAELSRLGRSMLECMEILALATRKGIRVYSVKGSWQLDDSIQSKIIALAVVPPGTGLTILSGKRHFTLKPADLDAYQGERGRRGHLLPRGFQRVDGVTVGQGDGTGPKPIMPAHPG